MLKLVYFVPESHLAVTKAAIFTAGAGAQGDYDSCCWQTQGLGQFRPLDGSHPYIGRHGEIEQVEEWRVELLCPEGRAEAVAQALVSAHPYEQPAYEFYPLWLPVKA